jgi:cytochrome P450
MKYLLQNQTHMEHTVHEIRNTFSSPSEITVSSTHNLPLLTAVIQESMRMSPSVVVGVPRVIPQGGATICNELLPEGTYVVVNQFAAFRSALNFTDPDVFDPNRFLQSTGKIQSYNQSIHFNPKSSSSPDDLSAFHPFSIGRHQCLGIRLAWAMLRLSLARLLYTFDVEFANPEDERNKKDFAEQKTFMFWEKEELKVKLSMAKSGKRD